MVKVSQFGKKEKENAVIILNVLFFLLYSADVIGHRTQRHLPLNQQARKGTTHIT
jgi:hypothetical protein